MDVLGGGHVSAAMGSSRLGKLAFARIGQAGGVSSFSKLRKI